MNRCVSNAQTNLRKFFVIPVPNNFAQSASNTCIELEYVNLKFVIHAAKIVTLP